MERYDEASLVTQLGISSEDAMFLQQVLSEEIPSETPDVTGVTNTSASVIDDCVIATANTDPILQRIPVEDNDSTSRFSSAIWYEKIQQQSIILAGLGGIGSFVAFLLSRMRPASLFIYDDDTVETVNMSGQMFGIQDVGKLKTVSVCNMITNYSDFRDTFAVDHRFDSTSQAGNIMICGFDNMAARRTFFNSWDQHVKSYNDVSDRAKCLFIDGRLAAESFQVLCLKGNDPYAIEKYTEHWLFSDDEAEETICSYKQTSFCANMIASTMVNCFVNFIANQCNPLIPRDVPFLTEYDASMMYFKTQS